MPSLTKEHIPVLIGVRMGLARAHIRKNVEWTVDQVQAAKRMIKAELDSRFGREDNPERVPYILDQISAHQSNLDADAQLSTVIYCISAMFWHEKYPSLADHEIQKISELALLILRAQGINYKTSRIRFLYREIMLMQSQLTRKKGDHWHAFWQAAMAEKFLGDDEIARQSLTVANRYARLGLFQEAIRRYQQINESSSEIESLVRLRSMIECLRCHRISGDLKAFESLAEQTRERFVEAPTQFKLEFEWELICSHAQMRGAFDEIVVRTKRGGTHFTSDYMLEAKLWAWASGRTKLVEKTYSLSTLQSYVERRSASVEKNMLRMIAVLAEVESAKPIEMTVMEKLGNELHDRRGLLAMDHEMLVWVSAWRLLMRSKVQDFAHVCLQQYQDISLRITQGQSRDALGLIETKSN